MLADVNGGARRRSRPSHLFVFIGAQPLTDWLPDEVPATRAASC